ncbi:hypothetical protein K440DRAFT_410838 [Wilcoxina mikolae CBS 423.85]|nr:hypothetical protein K440DRAFT_410838 [Wilcoxina mikolae CBS 423.85]
MWWFVVKVVEGVAETWWTERTLLLGDTAYQFSPLLHLSETLSLEAIATLINLLPPPQDLSLPPPSIPAIFTAFEQSHRPRVEWCQRISSFLTKAVTRSSRWHALFARWVLPRIPVLLVYEEFSLGATVLNAGFEDRKYGRFWDRIRKGTLGGLGGCWLPQ